MPRTRDSLGDTLRKDRLSQLRQPQIPEFEILKLPYAVLLLSARNQQPEEMGGFETARTSCCAAIESSLLCNNIDWKRYLRRVCGPRGREKHRRSVRYFAEDGL